MSRFTLSLLCVSTLGSLAFGCLPWVEETSVERVTRTGVSELVVRLARGSVSVHETLGTDLEVEILRSARTPSKEAARAALEALLLDFEGAEGSGHLAISGRVATAGAFRPWEELGLRLRITVPVGAAVDVQTGSGSIELHGLTGPTRATTASGRVSASDLRSPAGPDSAPILLRTADGNIQGENLEGRVRAETADGRIRLLGRLQQVTAMSADGRIEVVVAEGGAARESEWFLRTADGPVRLTLPGSTDALVSAVGTVTSDDDRDVSEWQREGPVALATLGDGSGPSIHLRASDGSIRVRVAPRD